jgi:hypothetical protein
MIPCLFYFYLFVLLDGPCFVTHPLRNNHRGHALGHHHTARHLQYA